MLATDSKAKMIRARFNEQYGVGALLLAPCVRSALVAQIVLGIVTAQEGKVDPDDVHLLLMMARKSICDVHGEDYLS